MPHPVDEAAPRSQEIVHDGVDRTADGKMKPARQRYENEQCEPEVRHCKERQRNAAEYAVERFSAVADLDDRDRDPESEAADQAKGHQQQRVRQRVGKRAHHGALSRNGESKVSAKYVRDVTEILLANRPIQPIRVAPCLPD